MWYFINFVTPSLMDILSPQYANGRGIRCTMCIHVHVPLLCWDHIKMRHYKCETLLSPWTAHMGHSCSPGVINNYYHLLPEVCLTSNLKVQTVPSYDVHHFGFWYSRKHPIIICVSKHTIHYHWSIVLTYCRLMTKVYFLPRYQRSIPLQLRHSHSLRQSSLNYH